LVSPSCHIEISSKFNSGFEVFEFGGELLVSVDGLDGKVLMEKKRLREARSCGKAAREGYAGQGLEGITRILARVNDMGYSLKRALCLCLYLKRSRA
jgi:hypothetical protein